MPPSKITEGDSLIRECEPCKRRKRSCNGQKPCVGCMEGGLECVYSVVSEHPRGVFGTNAARRLSSGSACETCRRRKTKCDGGNPCGFCASSGVDCINGSIERKKRANVTGGENEAMERIEDRLRRIERLMTAFTPSPLSKNCTTQTYYRKMSSPLLSAQKQARPPRHHSIHGTSSTEPKHSPPLSPRQNMFLSPSSSSSTATSTTPSPHMQSSLSTPTSSNTASWHHSTPIPSLMDQLSKLTFVSTMDYNAVQYPIYPIPSPSSKP
ncbi:hypothetical protein BY458DRAFT_502165 [Sporodiniella umbellata]|nr:hypothetical protein BY458DRAFT_502165 [Sporodiniella umbellata]